MPTRTPRLETLTASALGGRGWNRWLREAFYPTPYMRRPNVHYPWGPYLRLYLLSEVVRIEAAPEFQAAKAAIDARRKRTV